jgi:hypothetical protein
MHVNALPRRILVLGETGRGMNTRLAQAPKSEAPLLGSLRPSGSGRFVRIVNA